MESSDRKENAQVQQVRACSYRKSPSTFSEHALERIPIGWNRPIDKNTLKINLLEHVLIGKVSQLFRNML
jgi:hypothetical protein